MSRQYFVEVSVTRRLLTAAVCFYIVKLAWTTPRSPDDPIWIVVFGVLGILAAVAGLRLALVKAGAIFWH